MTRIEEVTATCCREIESVLGPHHDLVYLTTIAVISITLLYLSWKKLQ